MLADALHLGTTKLFRRFHGAIGSLVSRLDGRVSPTEKDIDMNQNRINQNQEQNQKDTPDKQKQQGQGENKQNLGDRDQAQQYKGAPQRDDQQTR